MTDHAGSPGHLAVDGCFNFRDAGGWPVEGGGRMRLRGLYRSEDRANFEHIGFSHIRMFGLAPDPTVLGWLALIEMVVFLAILGLALVYAWRKGALEWV